MSKTVPSWLSSFQAWPSHGFSPGPTPVQLLFSSDNHGTCVPLLSHISATYLQVKSFSSKFSSAPTGGTSSDLPLPHLGLFLPKTVKVSPTHQWVQHLETPRLAAEQTLTPLLIANTERQRIPLRFSSFWAGTGRGLKRRGAKQISHYFIKKKKKKKRRYTHTHTKTSLSFLVHVIQGRRALPTGCKQLKIWVKDALNHSAVPQRRLGSFLPPLPHL